MITSKITKSILLCLTAIFVSSCLHYDDVNTQDVDTDGDCYTDVWEKKWGYDPLDPNDPPDHDNDCMTDEQEKVTDTDGDGINDFWDNCENTPNATVGGLIKGTCSQGTLGINCTRDIDCGTAGVCSANQEDRDSDGVGDVCDNCLRVVNPYQKDADSDDFGDLCDNAPNDWNPGQEDRDDDGVPDVVDNCPGDRNKMKTYKRSHSMEWIKDGSAIECALYTGLVTAIGDRWQLDLDCDGIGDACDGNKSSTKPSVSYDPLTDDTDGDGVDDIDDNCPTVANADQINTDCMLNSNCDDIGDACDMDDDGDGIPDVCDASPLDPGNPITAGDPDGDGKLADCDPDDDGDGILDTCDADHPDNSGAANSDSDNIINICDNCDSADNPNQQDVDGNGIGDVCEASIRIKFEFQDLSPGGDSYDDWLPTDGRRAQITARLYQNGNPVNPQPAIACTLAGNLTSSYPGRYHNDHPDLPGVNPNSPKDPLYNNDPDYIIKSGTGTNSIVIESKDYGGHTVIKAETTDGAYAAELKIPRDVDDDGLPDRFERDPILNPSGMLNPLLADSDSNGDSDTMEDQDTSVNAASKGDGLSAFAEYRGVFWDGQHHRLSPEKKNLFVYGNGFTTALPLEIGPAFENAGLEIYQTTDAGYENTHLEVLIVTAYPSGYSTADRNKGHIRKIDTRKWDIPVLGESYFAYTDSNGVYHFGQPTRIFMKSIENYFSMDRPYLDKETLIAGTISRPTWGPENNMLDPLEWNSDLKVEDKNDDGKKGGGEDKNHDGKLNGDYVEVNTATWNNSAKLSPFNIDKDPWVELPQDKGLPQALDPNSKTAGKEYIIREVGRHVVTHEVGHAVGMGVGDAAIVDSKGHCLHDTNCLMFRYSIDWNRDEHFCPYHQSMIQIDNK